MDVVLCWIPQVEIATPDLVRQWKGVLRYLTTPIAHDAEQTHQWPNYNHEESTRPISKVGGSQPSNEPFKGKICRDKLRPNKNWRERSPNSTWRDHSKKNRSVNTCPFAKWIHSPTPDSLVKIPQFVLYNGHNWPQEHVCWLRSAMHLVTHDKAIMYKAFLNTLFDKVLTWFTSLKPGVINSWRILKKLFLDRFSTARTMLKTSGDLANIKQVDNETLLAYLDCFKDVWRDRRTQSGHSDNLLWGWILVKNVVHWTSTSEARND